MKTEANKSSIIGKIAVAAGSLIFFLVLLESALRFSGYLYIKSRLYPDRDNSNPQGMIVLCVGDSFTFGGELRNEETYPAQLQKILDERNPQMGARVINGGICEYNSSQVLRDLKKNIARHKPDLIVFLAGAANRFNFVGFDKDKRILSKVRNHIYSFRIYKMAKIILLNLRKRLIEISIRRQGGALQVKLQGDSYLGAIDPHFDILEHMTDTEYKLIKKLWRMGEVDIARKLLKGSLYKNKNPDILKYQYSRIMQKMYDNKNDDPQMLINRLKRDLKTEADTESGKSYKFEYYNIVKDILKIYDIDSIYKWLRSDLRQIAEVCAGMNTDLIFQDYPYPYPEIDKALREIAKEYSLPMVQNGAVFMELMEENEKSTYFQDDSHCTARGYRVIAENVYGVIIRRVTEKDLPI